VLCNISDRKPRSDYTKPSIESSKLAQKRLESRLTQPALLRTGRILERFQAVPRMCACRLFSFQPSLACDQDIAKGMELFIYLFRI
jgi:hypothetical protein